MRPNNKRSEAKKSEGSRYSKVKGPTEKVKIIKQVIVKEEAKEDPNIIFGRNSLLELLKGTRTIETIYVTEGDKEGSINKILSEAKDKKILIKYVDKKKLDALSNRGNHQGIVARVTDYNYCEIEDILNLAKKKKEKPFILLLDEIEDPHNLGSIIRTAELTGVHGIVIPKRRAVGVTSTVYKTSAGAVDKMLVARVTNLSQVTEDLKKEGIFIYGADIEGEEYSHKADFSGPCALVIGNEGKGMSQNMKEKCDKLIKIPMVGELNSLNASVAGGILMYEVMKGRLSKE